MTGEPSSGEPAADIDPAAVALASMPRISRIAFLLHARGLSFDRIARRLGISRRRLRRHMRDAVAHIDRAYRAAGRVFED